MSKKIFFTILKIFGFIILFMLYLILIDYITVLYLWEDISFINRFTILLLIGLVQIVSFLFIIKRKNNHSLLKLFNILNLILFIVLFFCLVIDNLSLEIILKYSQISFIKVWKMIILFLLLITTILTTVYIYIINDKIKKVIIILFSLMIVPISLWIVEECYYHSIDSGMIISDYDESMTITLFDNKYELAPRYQVKLVGDDGYYELSEIPNDLYVIYYETYSGDVQTDYESEKSKLIDEILNNSSVILDYNSDLKVELYKYRSENELFYIYDFSNFQVTDYSDQTNYYLSSLEQEDLLITFNDSIMYVYTRRNDNVYKYTLEDQDGSYVQTVKDEYIGDIVFELAIYEDPLNVELLDQTYLITEKNNINYEQE